MAFLDEPFPYLELVTGFTLIVFVLETTLDLRQHSALKKPSLPPALVGVVSDEKFVKARAYSLDKSKLHFVRSFVSFGEEMVVLLLRVLPLLWRRTLTSFQYWGLSGQGEVVHTLVFLAAWTLISQAIDLPFSLHNTFIVEAKHGFNKQTLFSFFKDLFLGLALSALFAPPIVAGIVFIVQIGGPYLALYLWLFTLSVSLFMMTIYPVAIAPLFNKFTPLPEGSLRTKIEDLAASLRFPLKKLFVVDGSKRSAHSNAYMYGFFNNKRIVLYDTLIQQCSEDEVVAVIGHELGHWKLKHTVISFLMSQVLTLLNFGGYAYIRNSSALFQSFGFGNEQPIIIGLILFQQIIIPLSHVLGLCMNVVSRAFEFQADEFAIKLGFAQHLRAGLVKLQEENLSAMNTDPWYSAYHYSHPPLPERLAAIDAKSKKQE